ncbi:MAG TPA: hypothetical protein VFU31_06055 [Candidatus Binatia bacterium]|nr:hypothetical protein [Candidatus Binatia bacterium]
MAYPPLEELAKLDTVEVGDYEAAVEEIYRLGWTDGLPVILPTPRLVQRVLDYLGRPSDEVIEVIPPYQGVATLEKIAINCVMAGCLPEYVPVVLAALRAMLKERFNLNGVQATTHCAAPLVIVSGPVVERLGFNSRDNLFAGGCRTNAAVGRAIRLILWNIGGARTGELDKAVLGHPGKWSYCIAEDKEWNPWGPLHADRGFDSEESCVTVFAGEAPHHIMTGGGYSSPEKILTVLADSLATVGNSTMQAGGDMVLVIGPLVARHLAEKGFSKSDVKEALIERARKPARLVKANEYLGETHPFHFSHFMDSGDDEALVPLIRQAENLLIVVAGGWGSGSGICAFIPGWGQHGGFAETERIDLHR